MSETRRLLLEFETERLSSLAKKDKRVREELIRAFSDASEVVRERALIAAVDLGDPTIVDDIAKAMSDNEDDVRIAAAQALAWYRQPRSIPALLNGLKDPNPWVRSHSAAGLAKLLSGPIWARQKGDVIDRFIAAFPDMTDDEIREFMMDMGIRSQAIEQYLRWRKDEFDVEIDYSIVSDLESGPLILLEDKEEAAPVLSTHSGLALAPEVESILAELPPDVLDKLPPEDLRRLTPETARELVDSLLEAPPEEPKKKKKKKVKVRKVKRVKRVKKDTRREELLAKIPPEVRLSVPEETLAELTIEELEALVAASPDTVEVVEKEPETEPEPKPKARPKKEGKKKKAKEPEPAPTADSSGPLPEDDATRKKILTERYGVEKAELLMIIPPEMLEGIPSEQIEEMDLETLKNLTQALGSH